MKKTLKKIEEIERDIAFIFYEIEEMREKGIVDSSTMRDYEKKIKKLKKKLTAQTPSK